MGAIANWRMARVERKAFSDAFDEHTGNPSPQRIRKWSDLELHKWLASDTLQPIKRGMAERELRRREAWAAPAGRAFWISCGALATSFAALAISVYR